MFFRYVWFPFHGTNGNETKCCCLSRSGARCHYPYLNMLREPTARALSSNICDGDGDAGEYWKTFRIGTVAGFWTVVVLEKVQSPQKRPTLALPLSQPLPTPSAVCCCCFFFCLCWSVGFGLRLNWILVGPARVWSSFYFPLLCLCFWLWVCLLFTYTHTRACIHTYTYRVAVHRLYLFFFFLAFHLPAFSKPQKQHLGQRRVCEGNDIFLLAKAWTCRLAGVRERARGS